jgi:hypothetical protein
VLLQHGDAPVTLYLAFKQPALLLLNALQLCHHAAVLLLQLIHQGWQLVLLLLVLLQHLQQLLLQVLLLLLWLCHLLVRGVSSSLVVAVLLITYPLHCVSRPQQAQCGHAVLQ